MACYYPSDGWLSAKANDNGRFPITFKRSEAQQDAPLRVPCGRCIGCRLDRSRQWGMRCQHESQLHEQNSFITLTYDDDNIPEGASLSSYDWNRFMRRLRKHLSPKKIRFYMGAEYGEQALAGWLTPEGQKILGRPHFHAILFGHQFDDLEIHEERNGNVSYTSETLAKIWGKGFVTVGEASYESACYVARYCMKKMGGELAEQHYKRIHPVTGEEISLTPEFARMSNRPGIGKDWFLRYWRDFAKGYTTLNGIRHAVPHYYVDVMAEHHPDEGLALKAMRRHSIDLYHPEMALDRLRIKQEVKERRTQLLKRD
ncbi:replication initiator protein [Microviridae sp.]|nr:replication initiator protein [Microviridae sp.]